MASRRKEILKDIHFRILVEVSKNPHISTRMLSSKLGISNGSSYYCIKALIQKGFVKLENFTSSENKRHYSYILTKKGIIEKTVLTADFLKRKKAEYHQIRDEINSVMASMDMQTGNNISKKNSS